ncbi:hypothetical protein PR048_020532 [Dryococelus australis]|uniref:Uncharacterized protein n=1 Tax=Dryococelus australis TaxID=614101 RepID=A0ABQ9H6N2_9NEOP|nr:hypothetical protein PR048_020532 [Dryococelus australis]
MFPQLYLTNLTFSATKGAYLPSDALGPYFRNKLVEDLRNCSFSLCFDETANDGGHKELQIRILFWSGKSSKVENRHLMTFLLALLETAVYLQLNLFVTLGSDGPNVNKKVFMLMSDNVAELRGRGLVQIGTCNLHHIHNAFAKGLEEFGDSVCELFYARFEDFQNIQYDLLLPSKFFIKHVSSRWLTLRPAAVQLPEQWCAITKYFLEFVPLKKSSLMKSQSYAIISSCLKNPLMKADILLVISSARMFSEYYLIYQKETPKFLDPKAFEATSSVAKLLKLAKIIPFDVRTNCLIDESKMIKTETFRGID